MRLVASDIDGTILGHDGKISARTVRAFHACRDAGVAAGVEGADGAGTDFSVVSKDRSVNIARYQPHLASLRGRPLLEACDGEAQAQEAAACLLKDRIGGQGRMVEQDADVALDPLK